VRTDTEQPRLQRERFGSLLLLQEDAITEIEPIATPSAARGDRVWRECRRYRPRTGQATARRPSSRCPPANRSWPGATEIRPLAQSLGLPNWNQALVPPSSPLDSPYGDPSPLASCAFSTSAERFLRWLGLGPIPACANHDTIARL